MKKKFLFLFVIILILGLVFWEKEKKTNSFDGKVVIQNQSEQTLDLEKQFNIFLIAVIDGQTAYDLLKTQYQVLIKEYDLGIFIEGINDLKNTDQYYWAFYLNDEYAQKGADQTILNKGDKIEFRYEEIAF